MPTTIGLLRAVNLAGRGTIAMPALKRLFEELGFEARTLLQSGNVVFKGKAKADAKLEAMLQKEAAERLGLRTEFFLRSTAEWEALIEANPFEEMAEKDPSHLVLMALKTSPPAKALAELRAAIKGRETVALNGRELYVTYVDGIGRSKLTTALIESKLGTTSTGRNWNTVLKLAALAKEIG